MDQEKNIRELLLKYVKNECTEEEYGEVLQFFQRGANTGEMPTVDEVLEFLNEHQSLDQEAADRIYKEIISNPSRKSQRRRSFYEPLWKYAAVVLFLLIAGGGILYQQGIIFTNVSLLSFLGKTAESDFAREDVITLELGNGEIEVIDPNDIRTVHDKLGNIVGQQQQNRLVYSGNQKTETTVYNTLRIPYSKRFEIELSDGTVVHLNSGTTMKFPVHFPENASLREVEIIGEAFFEVAHNEDQSFIVHAGDLDVRVLGTKFNLSTYPEDDRTDVVLVDGSVSLDTKNENLEIVDEQILKPGYKASFEKSDKSISMSMVPTSIYTSWINGELVFRDMKFNDILLKLERKYNVVIRNSNAVLARERFNASFGDVPLKTVLNYFEAIYNIEISMENDIVLIE